MMKHRQRIEDPQAAISGGGGIGGQRAAASVIWPNTARPTVRPLRAHERGHHPEQLHSRIFELEREVRSLREQLDVKDRHIVEARKQNDVLHAELEANYDVLAQVRGDIKILEDISRVDPDTTHRISATLSRRLTEIRSRTEIIAVSKMTGSFVETLRRAYPTLTDAELQVASFLRVGYSTTAIAATCCISERTVENHRLRIRRKLALPKDESLPEYLCMLDEHSSIPWSN